MQIQRTTYDRSKPVKLFHCDCTVGLILQVHRLSETTPTGKEGASKALESMLLWTVQGYLTAFQASENDCSTSLSIILSQFNPAHITKNQFLYSQI
jgi:hypothetical protein